ncbi:MAG: 1-acyl-sn-glycerol-3-phosphate acyltransferase [Pirellula sp.]|nr:1-acyl-sn-glycerol-3-phosphate acyltransferase [Pirellula sp.]
MTTETVAPAKPGKNLTERSFASRAWYETVRVVVGAVALGLFRLRCAHRERFPAAGGFLLLSNHQSHLDPPFVGLVVPRRVNFVARDTLFKNRFFAWLINSLDAIPIDREGLGLAGLKETMRRLKRGEIVLLFPEGTRTPDGEMQPLRPGFSALVQRTGVPIVPVALDGAYQAWPRNAKLPRPGRIQIVVGEPISTETAKSLDDRALVALVDERIRACLAEARTLRAAP